MKRWLVRVGVGLLLLMAVVAVGSRLLRMEETFRQLAALNPGQLAPILTLALVYYALKALRWHFYLRVGGIDVPLVRSLAAYLAGQWFAFTPAGELMRVYLLGAREPFSAVAPTVVMQAVMDFASLALMATLAVPMYPALAPVVLPVTLPLLLTLVMLATPPLRRLASTWRVAQRLTSGRGARVTGQFSTLLTPWPVTAGLLMGVPTVLAGGLAFFLSGLVLEIQGWDAVGATTVYSMTQLLGGVSPLPQGIGVAEGSGTALLGFIGIDPEMALAAMLLSRGAVLGFSVVLGLIALMVLRIAVPELREVPVGGIDQAAREEAGHREVAEGQPARGEVTAGAD